jgi:predicted RNA-binding Zn ribbon-like protein
MALQSYSILTVTSQMLVNEKGFIPMQKFLWLANWPALDFINTEYTQAGERIELFRTAEDVADWLRAAGLPDVPPAVRSKEQLLVAARGYRKCLHSGVERLVSSGDVPGDTISATNRLLEGERFSLRLQRGRGKFQLQRHWNFASPADYIVPVAQSFAELLGTADLSRIRRCKNPECPLIFYDTSKSATRSWCSLDLCGNKLRVAAFRKRHSN